MRIKNVNPDWIWTRYKRQEVHRDSYHEWLVISTTITGTHTATIAAHTGIPRMLSHAPLRHFPTKIEVWKRYEMSNQSWNLLVEIYYTDVCLFKFHRFQRYHRIPVRIVTLPFSNTIGWTLHQVQRYHVTNSFQIEINGSFVLKVNKTKHWSYIGIYLTEEMIIEY